jgi:hypothetical protein
MGIGTGFGDHRAAVGVTDQDGWAIQPVKALRVAATSSASEVVGF